MEGALDATGGTEPSTAAVVAPRDIDGDGRRTVPEVARAFGGPALQPQKRSATAPEQ
jgi:hypothetical protein